MGARHAGPDQLAAAARGSSFHFTAPLLPASQAPGDTQTPVEEQMAGISVLVVDDNTTNRRILTESLSRWGMLVTEAGSGAEALTVLHHGDRASPFRLVLTDAMMPEMSGFELIERIKADPAFTSLTIMMLTSAGERGDVGRCRQLGVSAYLTKPIRRAQLREAIHRALGGHASGSPTTVVTVHTLREGERRLRVLLAEDNPVNQQLAIRLLEKRGHSVTLAANGREAIDAFERAPFDLVLMDVQMPEVGGLEATAAIRKLERERGGHVPIVALTARAMTGDREQFLAAGMDGYLAKPFSAQALFAPLETLGPEAGALGATPARVPVADAPAVDRAALLEIYEGNTELLAELAELLIAHAPQMLADLAQAVRQQDASQVNRLAHRLRGSAANFAATRAVAAAARMEELGAAGNLARAELEFATLVEEMRLLLEELTRLALAPAEGLCAS